MSTVKASFRTCFRTLPKPSGHAPKTNSSSKSQKSEATESEAALLATSTVSDDPDSRILCRSEQCRSLTFGRQFTNCHIWPASLGNATGHLRCAEGPLATRAKLMIDDKLSCVAHPPSTPSHLLNFVISHPLHVRPTSVSISISIDTLRDCNSSSVDFIEYVLQFMPGVKIQ